MKFDVVKKGYDRAQVDGYIRTLTEDNDKTVESQREAIEQLKEDNRKLSEKIDFYDKKKSEILAAFVEAQEAAARLKRKANARFDEEMARLDMFRQKWTAYAKEMIKTLTPLEAEKFDKMSEKFRRALEIYAKDAGEGKEQAKTESFDPLKKVTDYLDGKHVDVDASKQTQQAEQAQEEAIVQDITEADILDVKQSLEELCKELGILDE